jgi:NADH-quinone oxidoreductase subunit D
VWLGTHALDIGAMTVFFYSFREREKVLSIYDQVCGARMTASYFRVGGLSSDIPAGLLDRCQKFVDEMPGHTDEYEALLSKNPIWLGRTREVAPLSKSDALALGATGPILRGSGVKWDLRKDQPYCGYERYEFAVPVGKGQFGPVGSCFDRNWVRCVELAESSKILHQALDALERMEKTDVHEKVPKRVKPPKGEVYFRSEAPRGQLGYYIVADGTGVNPYRVKVKSPCFTAMSAFHELSRNAMISDVVAIVGSLDIVLGEIDR